MFVVVAKKPDGQGVSARPGGVDRGRRLAREDLQMIPDFCRACDALLAVGIIGPVSAGRGDDDRAVS